MEDDPPAPCPPVLAEVLPGLWVCGEAALPAALADATLGITHVVSIGYPPPEDPTGVSRGDRGGDDDGDEGGSDGGHGGGRDVRGVKVLRIELEDDEDGDLLTQIPHVTAFISDGLRLRDAQRAMAAAAVHHEEEDKGGGVLDDGENVVVGTVKNAEADSDSPSTLGGGAGGGGGGGSGGGGDGGRGGRGGNGGGDGVGGGGVLVHCHAGVSRSSAVVAAHVMRTRGVGPDEALAFIRAAHPAADPNSGFLTQLALWHSMDCKLNMADEAFRLYSVAKLAREREYHGYINATSVQPDPGAEVTSGSGGGGYGQTVRGSGGGGGPPEWGEPAALSPTSRRSGPMNPSLPFSGAVASAPLGLPNGGGPEAGALIRCRKCCRLVARGKNALPHEPGVGLDAFSWHKRTKHGSGKATVASSGASHDTGAAATAGSATRAGGYGQAVGCGGAGGPPCQNVFLEPLAWMDGIEEGAIEGKLCCPKCEVKVGHFNWSGCQCSCGAWVTPAFYLQLGKIDVMQVVTPAVTPDATGRGGGHPAPPGGGAVRMPRKFAPRPAVQRPSSRKE